jgi:hypothetical protein
LVQVIVFVDGFGEHILPLFKGSGALENIVEYVVIPFAFRERDDPTLLQ